MSIENQTIESLKKAYKTLREASFQSHDGHWDPEGTHGQNCPECIRARKIRQEADEIFDSAVSLLDRCNST